MKQWQTDLDKARSGDLDAFGNVVREFQDMAVGYAYSVLGDFDLAEDAAQEAFIEAYQTLAKLRDVPAFPGWFRRIVLGQCSRQTRGKRVRTVPLDAAPDVASKEPSPMQAAQRSEIRERVLDAINALPEHERTAVSLFYINGYSQAEVGEFLDVPAKTVKSRLHSARGKLRERMIDMVETTLKSKAPGKAFTKKIANAIKKQQSLDKFLGGFPILETDRLILRELRPAEDAKRFFPLATEMESGCDNGFSNCRTVASLKKRIQRSYDSFYKAAYCPYWAITLRNEDEMIGDVRYWDWGGIPGHPWVFGSLQYSLLGEYSGKGIGAEALRAVGEFGLKHLGLIRVEAGVGSKDDIRVAEFEKAGFANEGLRRCVWYDAGTKEWVDEVAFSLVRRDLQ